MLKALLTCLTLGFGIFLGQDLLTCYDYSEFEIQSPKMTTYQNLSAVVLGGSGGIGRGIVRALAKSPEYSKVTLVGRRLLELPLSHSDPSANYDKFEQKIMDFDKIPEHQSIFEGHDAAFYALGVSSAQVTEEVYRKVEHDNAIALGQLIKDAMIRDVHWVTGRRTDKNSWFMFARVKAQVEEAVGKMGFRRVAFYRPAGIITNDGSGPLSPTASKVLKTLDVCNWMTIESDTLGEVIVANSLKEGNEKVEVFENQDMIKQGKANKK